MDTQGTFDSQSTVQECATIFALSTLLSSVQIYNLSQNLQEDDLQHLQLFTDYGKLALEKSKPKLFQKLTFLVRDWASPKDAKFGFEGGYTILQRRLKTSSGQHRELQNLRKSITETFCEISCFLMPHPGLKIATDTSSRGVLNDLEEDFKVELNEFIPNILAPKNLVTKKINGQTIKAQDLITYFRCYVEIYKGGDLPRPMSVLEVSWKRVGGHRQ